MEPGAGDGRPRCREDEHHQVLRASALLCHQWRAPPGSEHRPAAAVGHGRSGTVREHDPSFDVTRSSTFEAVRKWKEDLDQKENINIDEAVTCLLSHIMANETELLQRDDMSPNLDLGRSPPCSACLKL